MIRRVFDTEPIRAPYAALVSVVQCVRCERWIRQRSNGPRPVCRKCAGDAA